MVVMVMILAALEIGDYSNVPNIITCNTVTHIYVSGHNQTRDTQKSSFNKFDFDRLDYSI